MSKLYLMRHAKAAWAAPGMRDFDRPLEARGRRDAEAIGQAMQERGLLPELTLCSGARRTRETLEGVARNADIGRVVYSDALYNGNPGDYLAGIGEYGEYSAILVIGHNPMMEDLASALAPRGEQAARAAIASGFPTAGLAVIALPGGLTDIAPGIGYLEAFILPGDQR
ncbi:MAG: histidine phosphatase family protein [Rhizobiaceae bacterium]|nr:histidine phosphatase family protein [Rhizobiaceae bacterium]